MNGREGESERVCVRERKRERRRERARKKKIEERVCVERV